MSISPWYQAAGSPPLSGSASVISRPSSEMVAPVPVTHSAAPAVCCSSTVPMVTSHVDLSAHTFARGPRMLDVGISRGCFHEKSSPPGAAKPSVTEPVTPRHSRPFRYASS
jgi:hypothetical protein